MIKFRKNLNYRERISIIYLLVEFYGVEHLGINPKHHRKLFAILPERKVIEKRWNLEKSPNS